MNGYERTPKHIKIDGKIVIYSLCHFLHKMDTYGRMFDDSFDYQRSTRDESVGKFSKIRGYA